MNASLDKLKKALARMNAFAEEDKITKLPPKVKVAAKDGKFTMSYVDSESCGDFSFECDGDIEFVASLKDLMTLQALRSDPDVSVDGGKVTVKAGETKLRFPVSDVSEYPTNAPVYNGEQISIGAGKLKRLMDKVSYVRLEKDTRLFLTGVQMVLEGKNLIVTSTDGESVVRNYVELDDDPGFQFGGILSPRAIRCINGIEDEDTVELGIDGNLVAIDTPSAKIKLPLIAVSYPKVDKFFQNPGSIHFTLDKTIVLDSLKIFNLLDNEGITLSNSDQSLKLESDTGVSSVVDVIPMEDYTGEEFRFGMSLKKLQAFFSNMPIDLNKLRFSYTDSLGGIMFDDEESLQGYFMPMLQ